MTTTTLTARLARVVGAVRVVRRRRGHFNYFEHLQDSLKQAVTDTEDGRCRSPA
jgi:hypothetical protein